MAGGSPSTAPTSELAGPKEEASAAAAGPASSLFLPQQEPRLAADPPPVVTSGLVAAAEVLQEAARLSLLGCRVETIRNLDTEAAWVVDARPEVELLHPPPPGLLDQFDAGRPQVRCDRSADLPEALIALQHRVRLPLFDLTWTTWQRADTVPAAESAARAEPPTDEPPQPLEDP